MKIIHLILSITLLLSSHTYATTPTTRYLERHPIEKLIEYFDEDDYPISQHLPFFNEIIAQEDDSGFFGYHASTINFRIFQDILRVTQEEVFDQKLPENFYYFRIPGDPLFDLPDGKATFLTKHQSYDLTLEKKREAIKLFILEPLGIHHLDDKDIDIYWAYFYGIRKILQGDMTRLQKKLKFKGKDTKFLMQTLIKEKQMGFVSKGASDMLLPIITPIADIHHQPPFRVQHVLSYDNFLNKFWSCDNYELTWNIYRFFHPIWDTIGEQQAQLMAVNIPLFGNYTRWDECSITIFFENDTIEGGDNNLKDLLRSYYDKLGLDSQLVDKMWQLAQEKLEKAGVTTGVLFQLYHLGDLNHDAFVSVDFGVPITHLEPTEAVGAEKLPVNKYNVDLQLRLVMSNTDTLNPERGLRAIRYDSTPLEVSASILNDMRTLLHH